MDGILAKKLGMTQIFTKDGQMVSVTVLQAGPCTVTQKKTTESDGYNAVQVGFLETEYRKLNRPEKGHLQKRNLKAFSVLKEFRTDQIADFEVGHEITVQKFLAGDMLDVSGVSKGKGFQGVIKRHHKAGGPKSHGSCFHRSTGSIGQRTYPGKVFKNMKLPGHMGAEKVTVKNLQLVEVRLQENLLFVRGAVPGANDGMLVITNRAKDYLTRKAEVAPQEQASA
ncbi:MAG: 50S ribosomal protein L3 [Deltaproteobacteria bacterium]|nr:50S ribosomal protein L3 [Deltaproteobacteria bacterium]